MYSACMHEQVCTVLVCMSRYVQCLYTQAGMYSACIHKQVCTVLVYMSRYVQYLYT